MLILDIVYFKIFLRYSNFLMKQLFSCQINRNFSYIIHLDLFYKMKNVFLFKLKFNLTDWNFESHNKSLLNLVYRKERQFCFN